MDKALQILKSTQDLDIIQFHLDLKKIVPKIVYTAHYESKWDSTEGSGYKDTDHGYLKQGYVPDYVYYKSHVETKKVPLVWNMRLNGNPNYHIFEKGMNYRDKIKDGLLGINAIVLDFDKKETDIESMTEFLKKIIVRVNEFGLGDPTFVVESGGGYHFYYIFDDNARAHYSGFTNKQYRALIEHIAIELGLGCDNQLGSLAANLRAPGSGHFKNASMIPFVDPTSPIVQVFPFIYKLDSRGIVLKTKPYKFNLLDQRLLNVDDISKVMVGLQGYLDTIKIYDNQHEEFTKANFMQTGFLQDRGIGFKEVFEVIKEPKYTLVIKNNKESQYGFVYIDGKENDSYKYVKKKGEQAFLTNKNKSAKDIHLRHEGPLCTFVKKHLQAKTRAQVNQFFVEHFHIENAYEKETNAKSNIVSVEQLGNKNKTYEFQDTSLTVYDTKTVLTSIQFDQRKTNAQPTIREFTVFEYPVDILGRVTTEYDPIGDGIEKSNTKKLYFYIKYYFKGKWNKTTIEYCVNTISFNKLYGNIGLVFQGRDHDLNEFYKILQNSKDVIDLKPIMGSGHYCVDDTMFTLIGKNLINIKELPDDVPYMAMDKDVVLDTTLIPCTIKEYHEMMKENLPESIATIVLLQAIVALGMNFREGSGYITSLNLQGNSTSGKTTILDMIRCCASIRKSGEIEPGSISVDVRAEKHNVQKSYNACRTISIASTSQPVRHKLIDYAPLYLEEFTKLDPNKKKDLEDLFRATINNDGLQRGVGRTNVTYEVKAPFVLVGEDSIESDSLQNRVILIHVDNSFQKGTVRTLNKTLKHTPFKDICELYYGLIKTKNKSKHIQDIKDMLSEHIVNRSIDIWNKIFYINSVLGLVPEKELIAYMKSVISPDLLVSNKKDTEDDTFRKMLGEFIVFYRKSLTDKRMRGFIYCYGSDEDIHPSMVSVGLDAEGYNARKYRMQSVANNMSGGVFIMLDEYNRNISLVGYPLTMQYDDEVFKKRNKIVVYELQKMFKVGKFRQDTMMPDNIIEDITNHFKSITESNVKTD